MIDQFLSVPGRLFALATVLPLAAAALMLLCGMVRNAARAYREESRFGRQVYWFFGGDQPLRSGAYFAVGCMLAATALAFYGLYTLLSDHARYGDYPPDSRENLLDKRWSESVEWVGLGGFGDAPAVSLNLGYQIDHLAALMFAMVTLIGTCIFVFSLGYMKEETQQKVTDHAAHHTRRGRFGRFFMYMSLFAFSMLNLIIADNLFQVFISWELVGVCSFFLIGFYSERPSAGTAANKAFIMNRVGDAGFLVGLAVLWTYLGTFQFGEIEEGLATLPDWAVILAGIGVFLGCVGKSAQVPLHTWLPDAMEGPTPVSALIHAATMVAAGVYLVGRCYFLFTEEVLLLIAYVGMVTLFLGASIALVMTDIKRVLAYSTVSQLGYMMLALGVGAWGAALLHLLTHAFFKSLLFLGSGSVIHGCHHEQDMRKMGGLAAKMPVTAVTMLIGVLAIVGTPLFSGWYSKDAILVGSLGYTMAREDHWALFAVPLFTAALTGFYMFRMWFLTFTGKPRDKKLFEKVHESPRVMTLPLLLLAAGSIGIAWGWPIWDVEASKLGELVKQSEPEVVEAEFAREHRAAHKYHMTAGILALVAAGVGVVTAFGMYYRKWIDPEKVGRRFGFLNRFLSNKWYIDDAYDALAVRPTVALAEAAAAIDKPPEERRYRLIPETVDGLLTAPAMAMYRLGLSAKWLQSGRIRVYVTVLALTAVAMLAILSFLT